MNNIPNITEKPQRQYNLQHLLHRIDAEEVLTGERPKELEVSKEFITWYENQLIVSGKQLGIFKALNMDIKKAEGEIKKHNFEFDGIKLVVKDR